MSLRIVERVTALHLSRDPTRQLVEELEQSVRGARDDELGSVLCGVACFLAAAGGRDGAVSVLELVDELELRPSTLNGAKEAAIVLGQVLELPQSWCAGAQLEPRGRNHWAVDGWSGTPSSAPVEELDELDYYRRALLAARTGDHETACAMFSSIVEVVPLVRVWMWSKAMLVLCFSLIDSRREPDAAARIAELVDVTRRMADVFRDPELLELTLGTGCLHRLFGIDGEELAHVATAVAAAALARSSGPARVSTRIDTTVWSSWLVRWDRGLRRALEVYDVHAEGCLTRPPATAPELALLERRLGMALPPSFRSFLLHSNGFQIARPALHAELLPTDEIDWFRDTERKWVEIWTEEPDEDVSDDDYRVYGADLDEGVPRRSYLWDVLQISAVDNSSVWLLNPSVRTADGEWECWEFSNSIPGALRWPSFVEMISDVLDELEDPG